MTVIKLVGTSSWQCKEQIAAALAREPQRILFGFAADEEHVFSFVISFKFAAKWELLYKTGLTFTRKTSYYEMVEVINSLTQQESARPDLFMINTEPFEDFTALDAEQVQTLMLSECYMAFNKRNLMKLLTCYPIFEKPNEEYPVELDLDILGGSRR